MFTKETRPMKVYKVVFEHLPTGIFSVVYVESTSSYDAGQTIINQLGKEYDLIKSCYVTKDELN